MNRVSTIAGSLLIMTILGACATGESPSRSPSTPPAVAAPSPAASATSAESSASPSPQAGAEVTVTLGAARCDYAGPASVPAGRIAIHLVNERTGQFDVDLWLLNPGHTYDELKAHIDEERRRGAAGEPELGHPTFATLVGEATASGPSGELVTQIKPGTYGIACVLFATDSGGIWAAGPFTVSP